MLNKIIKVLCIVYLLIGLVVVGYVAYGYHQLINQPIGFLLTDDE